MSTSDSSTFQPADRNSEMILNFRAEMAWLSPVPSWLLSICSQLHQHHSERALNPNSYFKPYMVTCPGPQPGCRQHLAPAQQHTNSYARTPPTGSS